MSKIQVGNLNMVSSRNIDNDMNYVLIKSYMGGSKKEDRSSKHDDIKTIEDAINKVVKATPGGEFLRNVKVYLINKKYVSVEGDVWGTEGVKENYRGFTTNDHVIYKTVLGIQKGKISALKNDKYCFFQEFGDKTPIQIGYDKITKASFSEKEIEEYVNPPKKEIEKTPVVQSIQPNTNTEKKPKIQLFKKKS